MHTYEFDWFSEIALATLRNIANHASEVLHKQAHDRMRKRSPKPDKGAEFAVLLGFIWRDAMSLGFRTS